MLPRPVCKQGVRFSSLARRSTAEHSGRLRTCGAHSWARSTEVQLAAVVWAQAAATAEGPPSTEPAGTAPHPTRSHDLGRGCRQRRPALRPSLPRAFLPGRDFLPIIDRRRAAELVAGLYRKVSLAGQTLCSLRGHQGGALTRPLFCLFFSPRGLGLRGRLGLLALPPT